MRIANKKSLIGSTVAATVVSVLSGIFFSPAIGVITAILLSVIGLIVTNINVLLELRNELEERLHTLDVELATIKHELATKAGLPLISKYVELQERNCPLFRRAALEVYKNALADLDALAEYKISVPTLEEVFYWLEILFCQIPIIKSIRAISFGEFKEWQECNTWWMQNYLRLHRVALQRGADIERVFIVKSHHYATLVQDVFRNNIKHHINVRVGLHARIQQADMQNSNCLLFFDEQHEPLYALVAKHDHKGDFESAVIYGDPDAVKRIAASYYRIKGISEPYRAGQCERLAPRKTA